MTLPSKDGTKRKDEWSNTPLGAAGKAAADKEPKEISEGTTDQLEGEEKLQRQKLQELRDQFSELRQGYTSKTRILYPPTIAISFAAFIIVFLLTTFAIPSSQASPQTFNDKFQLTIVLSITAGIVPLIVFAALNSIHIEEQNDKLSAKSFEIRNKRSDIALLRQIQAINHITRRQTSKEPTQAKTQFKFFSE